MTPEQQRALEIIQQIRGDFGGYAPKCLRILTKAGQIKPFTLNKAQIYIHEQAEEQIKRKGYVRKIVLKGRQQGASTYIAGRFYWRATGSVGKNVGILTHEQKATDNLFTMVRRYHEHCPASLRPSTAADSAKELWFDRIDVRYKISTAGAKGTGRSSTIQFFHGSEVAFWPNAAAHMAGIGQAVPLLPGTEVFLESTANGIGNLFHNQWEKACRGESEYEPVFVPWFWEDGYRLPAPAGFQLDPVEAEYRDAFDLDLEQMVWRRNKILTDFDSDVSLFDQEYPATPAMAFMAGSKKALISPLIVAEAAKPKPEIKPGGALVIGVDPAEYGDDHTGIVVRHGRKVLEVHRLKTAPMELVGLVAMMIDRINPDAVCIDVGGSHAVADRLIELNYTNVYKINFGASAIRPELYINKRIEIWDLARRWLLDYPCEIIAHPVLMADLSAPEFTYDSSRRKVLESKEKMQRRGISSPDLGDALALTFAVNVQPREKRVEPWRERLNQRRTSESDNAMTA